MAAHKNNTEALQVLIGAGADVNAQMSQGSCHSPLTIAALQGHLAAHELLVANGADTAYEALPKLDQPFKTAGGTAEQILNQNGAK